MREVLGIVFRVGIAVGERIRATKRRAAVGTRVHLFGVRRATRAAEAERSGLAVDHGGGGRPDLAQDELLRPDTNAIPIRELLLSFEGNSIDPTAVAASEVLENCVVIVDEDPRMPARNGRIEDGDVAFVAPTDEGVTRREIEFLQQKAQSISRWIALARVAHSVATLASPPGLPCDIRHPYGRISDSRTDAFTAHSYAAVLGFQALETENVAARTRKRAARTYADSPGSCATDGAELRCAALRGGALPTFRFENLAHAKLARNSQKDSSRRDRDAALAA